MPQRFKTCLNRLTFNQYKYTQPLMLLLWDRTYPIVQLTKQTRRAKLWGHQIWALQACYTLIHFQNKTSGPPSGSCQKWGDRHDGALTEWESACQTVTHVPVTAIARPWGLQSLWRSLPSTKWTIQYPSCLCQRNEHLVCHTGMCELYFNIAPSMYVSINCCGNRTSEVLLNKINGSYGKDKMGETSHHYVSLYRVLSALTQLWWTAAFLWRLHGSIDNTALLYKGKLEIRVPTMPLAEGRGENYSTLRKCCRRDKETEWKNVSGCECVWYHIKEREGQRERESVWE